MIPNITKVVQIMDKEFHIADDGKLYFKTTEKWRKQTIFIHVSKSIFNKKFGELIDALGNSKVELDINDETYYINKDKTVFFEDNEITYNEFNNILTELFYQVNKN